MNMQIQRPRFYPLYNLWLDNWKNAQLGGHGLIHTATNAFEMDDIFVDSLANFTPYDEKTISTEVFTTQTESVERLEFMYLTGQYQSSGYRYYGTSSSVGFNYFGITGHNFEDARCKMRIAFHKKADSSNTELGSWVDAPVDSVEPLFNCSVTVDNSGVKYIVPTRSQIDANENIGYDDLANGSFMFKLDPDEAGEGFSRYFKIIIEPLDSSGFQDDVKIGSFVWGRYFDMPSSPDLSYSMNFEYDGVKTKKTVGGSDITNISYVGSPGFCGRYEGFGRENNDFLAMGGRRTYNMNFSSLRADFATQDSEYDPDKRGHLFPETHLSNTEARYGNNFLSRFSRYTLNGQLPFIFEADTTVKEDAQYVAFWSTGEHNEANFMVAKLPNSNLSFKHKTHKHFDVSMKVVESW